MPDVLVVEDNAVNRKLIGLLLSRAGYTFAAVADGAEAIAALRGGGYRVVLMDMMMPGVSGYDATAAIRADPALRAVPIVAVTANALAGEEERCRALGCVDWIAKPYSKERVLDAVERLIGAPAGPATKPVAQA